MTTTTQTHPYQAEVARLLHLMVHSVYTEKDVFLRELIANASDALDKRRYLALTDQSIAAGGFEPAIHVTPDVLQRTLTVADNGIGMTKSEMMENLGTIAKSGTRAFLDGLGESETAAAAIAVSETPGANQIGQFGIGFYAAFMVAERVEVRSRKATAADAWLWASDGASGFTIDPLAAGDALLPAGAGTAVTLFLRDEALQFLKDAEIERVVEAYSTHIQFPITLVADNDGRQLNTGLALWAKPKAEISAGAYRDFYQQITHHFDDPALTIHYRAEGRSDYAVLLFVPTTRPFDLFDPSRKGRIKLYVRRVFISDDADLLPGYLRFVRGVVDSHDMPLNISREMLQNNPTVAGIRKALAGRVLNELKAAADKQPDDYVGLWEAFGAVLKEGLYEEPERRDALLQLTRFRSTAGDGWRSLKDYAAALKVNQTAIFYLVGDNLDRLKASPQLEGFRARGVEVLLLTDAVDAFWVTTALGHDGKPFQSVSQGQADLDLIPLVAADASKPPIAVKPERAARIVAELKLALGDAVSEVRVSNRLTDSPACLVASASGPDRALGKMLERQAQAGRPSAGRPILEINAGHVLLEAVAAAADSGQPERAADLAWTILDQARIQDGEAPADPAAFASRLTRLLTT